MKEIIRAAFVIGRRDFTAIIYSKAFIFFLLGPLFPLLVGVAAGGIGGQVAKDISRPAIGVALSQAENTRLVAAREVLAEELGDRRFPTLTPIAAPPGTDPQKLLDDGDKDYVAILSGSLDKPLLTGTRGQIESWRGQMALLSGYAASGNAVAFPEVGSNIVRQSSGNAKQVQLLTAQAAQTLLFMLTMLLAGMVLSNLVEEKSNKIIEVLAASIPMESVFIGKLFAMLAMACCGIIVWFGVGIGVFALLGANLPPLPAPAVGWPVFFTLGIVYFGLAYLMLGALFLGIGAMAATVREVQTLSMPVTMAQLIVFFLSMYSVTKLDQPMGVFASIFPFSSPFTMIARAAQDPTLWHHGVAIVGQILFAILVLRIGVFLFKRNVMKSGSGGKIKDDGKRRLFGLIKMRS